MKKFAICCLALASIALFVPTASAATTCFHLTYFCDGVQSTTIAVGGIQKTEAVGLWDWLCLGNGTGTLDSGGNKKFGTQPLYPYSGGFGYGFNANFTFGVVNTVKLFDLYGTFDGTTTFAFQLSSPYSTSKGPCNPLHVQKAKQAGLKPATMR